MKYFYLFLSFLFFSTAAIAQTNYKAGFIITANGETINGYINYKDWIYNPSSVGFKPTLNDKVQNFKPTDLRFFEVSGFEAYQSAHVSVSMGRTELQTMKSEIDSTTVIEDVFLKQLRKGDNVSLFSLADEVKTRYYIIDNKSTEPARELSYQPYYDPKTATMKSKNGYSMQLIELAKKYRPENFDVTDNIVHAKYTQKALDKIIAELNNQDPAKSTAALSTQPAVRPFAGVGINISNFNYVTTPGIGTTRSTKTSYLPKISIGIDAPFNPNVGRLLFRTELSFTAAKGEITVIDPSPTTVSTKILKLDQQTVSLRPQLIYNFYNADNFKFYLGAGININYSHYPASSNKTTVKNDVPTLSYTAEDKYQSATNLWFQFAPKAGINIGRKWDININYFLPANQPDISQVPEIRIKGFDFGINYYWGK
jgi:outer membrane protein W